MKHTYKITLDDLAAFNEYAAKKLPVPGLWIGAAAFLIAFGFIMLATGGNINPISLIAGLVFLIIYIWAYKKWGHGLYVKWYAKKVLKGSKIFDQQHSVEIRPEGLRLESDEDNGQMSWKTVVQIEQDKKYIFILLDSSRGFVISNNSFSSAKASTQFFEELRKCWNLSKAN